MDGLPFPAPLRDAALVLSYSGPSVCLLIDGAGLWNWCYIRTVCLGGFKRYTGEGMDGVMLLFGAQCLLIPGSACSCWT